MIKRLISLFFILVLNVCLANAYYHEFDGIDECYNIRNLNILSRFLPNNPIIIEAGAYKGRDTIKLAKKFSTGKVYAFEPLSTGFSELSALMQSYSNVFLFNKALDRFSGERDLYVCHGTGGKNTIFEFHSSLLKPNKEMEIHLCGPMEKISCVSLFDFCRNNKIKKIDMLWLSTEGNELQILEGARKLINRVSLVYVRSNFNPSREYGTSFEQLEVFMKKNNFVLLSHFYLKGLHGDALFIKKTKLV